LYHRFARRPPGWRTHIFVFGFRRVLDLPVLIVGAHAIRPASSEVGGNIPLCCANLHGIAHSPTYNPRPVIPALRYGRRSQPVPAGRAPPTAAPGCCSCTQRIERRACDPTQAARRANQPAQQAVSAERRKGPRPSSRFTAPPAPSRFLTPPRGACLPRWRAPKTRSKAFFSRRRWPGQRVKGGLGLATD
jgi:hypothetical protein